MAAKQAKRRDTPGTRARRTSKRAPAPKAKKRPKPPPAIRQGPKKEPKREQRIAYEIIVDCHDREEAVMGWYYYLEDKLQFPFTAQCVAQRAVSPLEIGQRVEVIEMGPADESQNDMLVMIDRRPRPLAVPLAQLKPLRTADAQTKEAVADWHYWLAQGYDF